MNLSFNKKLVWSHKVDIVPQAKQSGKIGVLKKKILGAIRCFNCGNTPMSVRGMMYPDKKKKAYQDAITASFLHNTPRTPFIGPMGIQVTFGFPFTKADEATKAKRQLIAENGGWIFLAASNNDYDNLCKPLNDSMNKVIIQDDGMISKADIFKIKCHKPFVSIKLFKLTHKGETL